MKNSGVPLSAFSPRVQALIRAAEARPGAAIPVAGAKPVPAPAGGGLRQRQGPALNKTEAAFLQTLEAAYPPRATLTQAVTLAIANGCRYTPDFFQPPIESDRARAFEVKGFMRDDAAVKLKVAAALFPWIRFFLVTRRGRAQPWRIQEILP